MNFPNIFEYSSNVL